MFSGVFFLAKIAASKNVPFFLLLASFFQYFLMVVIIFVLEIVAGILAFVFRDEVSCLRLS